MSKKELQPDLPKGQEYRWSFFFRLTLLVMGLGVAVLLAWNLAHLLLLAFLAILVAILLRSISILIYQNTPCSPPVSLVLATVGLLLTLGAFGALLGSTVHSQFKGLVESLPDLLANLGEQFGIENPETALADQLEKAMEQTSLVARFAGLSSTALGAATNLLLVLIAGVYLAADPATYRKGFLLMLPASTRSDARETVDVVIASLKLWLLGQLLGMLLVGLLTTAGLWFLGVPSAIALGILAGLLEFVPILGPIVAAVPAVATGFSESRELGFWVLGLYILIQQIEGNLLTPLIQQRMVKVPPALTIFAVVGFAVLFGPLGALVAMPLLVLLFVVVKKVWIKETLEEDVHLPGEKVPPNPTSGIRH